MTIIVFVLLVAFVPCISSSPTPKSTAPENNNNNMIYNSNAFVYDPNDYQADSSLLSSSSVHDQSPFFYDQPRTQANQFLISHANDNQIIVPKWFTRFNNNNDDDDDIDDYAPGNLLINKRSSFYNTGGYQNLKKRKQLTKPPMEVMNEIVNSIYLKR
jgi:hypothetical protein